jgi:transcriptional regulator with XRE-family HTH domain
MSNIEPEPDPLDPRPAATIQGRLEIARGHYTQKEFGEKIHRDANTVSNYESGATQRLDPLVLEAWVKASPLDCVTLEWLIGDWVKPGRGLRCVLVLDGLDATHRGEIL